MKAIALLAACVATASATYGNHGGQSNDGYYPDNKPIYPVYPVKPIHPVYPVYPQQPIVPVQPLPTVVTITETASAAPAPTPTKLPTTMSCKKWNRLVNEEDCEFVAKKKCTTVKDSKKSKFEECNRDTCCTEEAPEEAPATTTVVSCAEYCGKNSLQCQVVVDGACALEGPFGQYNQCSKELCCREAAPVIPQPQIVSCKAVVAGNGWSCGYVPKYGCSLTGPSGNYPACTYDVCCAFPGPPKPVDPCQYCDLPYAYCPDFCKAPNGGYTKY